MASIPSGAFLAPHSCHDSLRKEMEMKRNLEGQSSSNSTSVSPASTPPSSPRKYDPPSPYSPLASLKKFLWPNSFTNQPQFCEKPPEAFQSGNQRSLAVPGVPPAQVPPTKDIPQLDKINNASKTV